MTRATLFSLVAPALVLGATFPLGPNTITNTANQLPLRHCNWQAFTSTLAEGDLDAWFDIVTALDGTEGAVSFESTNFPGEYLAPIQADGILETTRIGLVPAGAFDPADATFLPVPGLADPSQWSFLSLSKNVSYAGLYLTTSPGSLSGICSGDFNESAGDVFLDDGSVIPAASTWSVHKAAGSYQMTIDARNVTNNAISPLFIGCHSDSGYTRQPRGFYSQMVIPDAFEPNPDGYWLNVTSANLPPTSYSIAYDPTTPFGYNKNASMKLTLASSGSGSFVGLSNRGLGQEGLTLEGGKPYEGYLFVKLSGSASLDVTVSLNDYTQGSSGAVLATQVITVRPSPNWQQINFTLTPSASTNCVGIAPGSNPVIDCGDYFPSPDHICVQCGGEFRLGITTTGSINVGYVFLQPGSWGRLNDLPVLASAVSTLQAMGTRVVRQGGTFSQTMAWKEWRGVPWARPSLGHVWGESLVSGWGPFEFVDMCNALGIEPIVTLQEEQSVDDWADLVEYLFGDESTQWGAVRIYNDSHPAAYNITWFELGNEEYNDNWVAQAAAMEKRASEIGMGGKFRYMFPTNEGLNSTDAAKAQAAGIPVHNIMPDIHITAGGAIEVAQADFAALPDFQQSAINCETNACSHNLLRGLQEAADLNDWFSTPQPTIGRMRARTASFCMERSGHFDNFDQGLSFFLSNMTWLQPPGYVHQMVSNSWADKALNVIANFSESFVSYSSQLSADNSQLVIRLVNQFQMPITVQVTVQGFNASSKATKTVLTSASISDVNTPSQPTLVAPQASTPVTFVNGFANVTVPAISYVVVTANAA